MFRSFRNQHGPIREKLIEYCIPHLLPRHSLEDESRKESQHIYYDSDDPNSRNLIHMTYDNPVAEEDIQEQPVYQINHQGAVRKFG